MAPVWLESDANKHLPCLSLPLTSQMTRKCKFCIALVTAPPPASSHWSGQYCSYHCCCCKLSEGVCLPWLMDWNGLRGRDKHSKAPALGTPPTTRTRCHHEASEGSVLRVLTERSSTSRTVPSLPSPQRDGGRSGEGPFPAVSTFKPKKQAVRTWPIKRVQWEKG